MNRRKPPLRLAVVPLVPGADKRTAVLRKAAGMAVDALTDQVDGMLPDGFAPFVAGYALGFARHVAMKHDVDCEGGDGPHTMDELAAEIAPLLSSGIGIAMRGISFSRREVSGDAQRARLRLGAAGAEGLADAGYLVGHLEALCGSRMLVRKAIGRMQKDDEGARAFVTDCDFAADKMQSHLPTTSLRFTAAERTVILEAFASPFLLSSGG
ncbi:hypothetical protein [Aestuariivirga sp.]|uniref:hypothetical protein n=1 Tax=Aestuariivirga sp. TaxID=2650926 RepID=UPI00359448B9